MTARCASPPMYLVRCRWWTPREYMSGPLACRAPEGPVCREARAWCDVAAASALDDTRDSALRLTVAACGGADGA